MTDNVSDASGRDRFVVNAHGSKATDCLAEYMATSYSSPTRTLLLSAEGEPEPAASLAGGPYHPIPGQQHEPADPATEDHPAGGAQAVAQAVAESSLHPGNGARGNVPHSRGLPVDRQQPGRGGEALFTGDRRAFPGSRGGTKGRGTESGTASARIGS